MLLALYLYLINVVDNVTILVLSSIWLSLGVSVLYIFLLFLSIIVVDKHQGYEGEGEGSLKRVTIEEPNKSLSMTIEKFYPMYKSARKVLVVSLCLFAVIPSSDTMKLAAGAYVGEVIITSETTNKILNETYDAVLRIVKSVGTKEKENVTQTKEQN